MSKILINQYRRDLETRKRFGGSHNEGSIRYAFATLLNGYCKPRDFALVEELTIPSRINTNIRLDGIVKDALRLDWGYWEAKDEKDSLDAEIEEKFKKGYPTDNILFEDTKEAVLIQNGTESLRIDMESDDDLDKLINQFLDYERKEVKDFRTAISSFSQDLPTILDTLRKLIDSQENLEFRIENLEINNNNSEVKTQGKINYKFIEARDKFLKVCQESINPDIDIADIREMIIQHILTEDIFNSIFNDAQFHQENNIASQLNEVIKTFFTRDIKKNTFKTIQSYYTAIIRTASNIVNHHEKQKFLKVVYENFYKIYNPKGADRLGIVYTPNEIVKFMVESTDYLLDKHFNKSLGSKGVEILDPCTGTGTFITEILDYLLTKDISYKYENEIHCNEVSILPYYIANLNIEYTYQQRTGQYLEFKNICLMDTLLPTDKGEKQMDMFAMNLENSERIKRQNERKISVIIGNPPYNAKQENFNDNNANFTYPSIDSRIKESYIKEGTAQNQIVVYDMYTRFIRWATDRLNDDGIIAFVSNSSFIDARAFDGLRKCLEQDFDYIYILDLGGNVRAISGRDGIFISEKHTIFGVSAMTGIAIYFLIKDNSQLANNCLTKTNNSQGNKDNLSISNKKAKIYYCHPFHIHELRENKLSYINSQLFKDIPFELITPDKNNNWINLTDNDFDDLIPLIDKDVKAGKVKAVKNEATGELENKVCEEAIFQLFSRGVATQRDEWVYDIDKDNLEAKVRFLINTYQATLQDNNYQNKDLIKWDAELASYLKRNIEKEFNDEQVILSLYRPFTPKYLYFDKHLNGRTYQWFNIYNQDNNNNNNKDINNKDINNKDINNKDYLDNNINSKSQNKTDNKDCQNKFIAILALGNSKPFHCLITDGIIDLHLTGDSQCLPLYRYEKEDRGEKGDQGKEGNKKEKVKRIENITDWALEQFRNKYEDKSITKPEIFNYVYGVLHNPEYRQKYELNLKREFPRIPFYDDFWQWAEWGKQLMELHLNYETIKPYKLKRIDTPLKNELATPKPKLKADKTKDTIIVDEVTTLENVPAIAFEYKLGNRSAIEWILDQYKEKKPKDKTIAEKFNNYQFADYKEQVIDLLMRVTTVSVETMKIINQMNN